MSALLIVLACGGVSSCKDNDKDEPSNSNSVVVKWNCYEVVLNSNGSTYQENVDFDFKSDKSFTVDMHDGRGTFTGTYTTTEAGAFTAKFDGSDLMGITGTYTISGDKMVAKYQWDNSGTAYLKRVK